ncbi:MULTISPECIES: class III poly(R)-hydroxyalkanoic acid synthase subunit PhaE [unclassified Ectothiorhodospira]|uniref:class III poly(R)-hydroxyalkanoic acid synthase subunit PhaE n=1 Tax=unclassified Ectothiorhodospira TaxID=2684909 RepID=UPI001EE79494|nr:MULTISPECIES: class III poly(R)-hydroxyalkanoic acid synthase subunit PhaE [unclassified Ectothiorhodospira]MCG5516347.1 class III poly(R)-hydroxyalkanoic acid synthase subunit PhaE [Ectothiorhodospira sp. 9100]MCG5518409.1 class III poly(R)-hydroxyalkanoic acid synthase subunit PhaE [Ectothiorhodospira sp. 9905]
MADSNPFAPDEWLDAQRKYWDAWLDMSRKAMGGQSNAPSWPQGLDQWWQAASQGLPGGNNQMMDQMMQMGRNYFAMAENFYKGTNGQADAGQAVTQWLDQMTNAFKNMGLGQMPGKSINPFWQMPMDTWSRAGSSFMPMPGDFMQALRPAARPPYGDVVQEQMDRFLSVPGVGYTRESQEQYQNLAKLMMEYQQAMQQYQQAFAKVGLDSVDRFRARLDDAGRQDTPITSMRGLYDEWVDVSEEVYGEFVMSEEYAKVYGDMVNSLMAVKRQGTRLMDEVTESLNMPTRREVNTLHRRLQESRREMHQIKAALRELQQEDKKEKAKATPSRKTSSTRSSTPKSGSTGTQNKAASTQSSAKADSTSAGGSSAGSASNTTSNASSAAKTPNAGAAKKADEPKN